MSSAAYHVSIHKRALAELRGLPEQHRDMMRQRLAMLGETEEPTARSYAKSLDGSDLLRVRAVDWRAICALDKPEILVLAVGNRETIYRKIDTALERGNYDG